MIFWEFYETYFLHLEINKILNKQTLLNIYYLQISKIKK